MTSLLLTLLLAQTVTDPGHRRICNRNVARSLGHGQADCGPPASTGPSHFFTLTPALVSDSRSTPAFQTNADGTMTLVGPGVVRVEAAGILNENSATNLLVSSQLIGNANWIVAGSGAAAPVVTLNSADVLAPDGTQTASKLVFPASAPGGYSVVFQGVTSATGSVYLRTLSGTATVWLTQGLGGGGGLHAACIATTTWSRCLSPLGSNYQIGWNQSDSLIETTSGGTVYVWGAQAEATGYATSYFPTGTNLMVNSSSVGGSGWSVVGSVTAPVVTLNTSDVLAPDGTQTASKIAYPSVTTASGNYALVGQNVLAPSVRSVYLRVLSGTATIYLNDGNDVASSFAACNLTTAWQRCSVLSVNTTGEPYWLGSDTRTSSGQTPGIPAVTVYAWGSQAESGTVPSSYMAVGATVTTTRALDVLTFANPLHSVNPTNWTWGMTLTPHDAWANVYSTAGGASLALQVGTQGATSSARALIPSTIGGTGVELDVWDNAGTELTQANAGGFTGSAPVSVTLRSAAGVLAVTPGTPGAPSGTGAGTMPTQPSNITLGFGASVFNFQGWYSNVYVDNQ